MGFLVEALCEFLPGKVETLRAYLVSCVMWMLIIALCATMLARKLSGSWAEALPWAGATAGIVMLGFALAYPFVRDRLTARP